MYCASEPEAKLVPPTDGPCITIGDGVAALRIPKTPSRRRGQNRHGIDDRRVIAAFYTQNRSGQTGSGLVDELELSFAAILVPGLGQEELTGRSLGEGHLEHPLAISSNFDPARR